MLIEGVALFQSFGYYGGELGNVLSRWQQLGVFSYLLPFLIIFALVFGILTRINLFGKVKEGGDKEENKAINSIIALSVALMALQFDLVTVFFSDIFPRLGVGLAIILVALILLGLFADFDDTKIKYGFLIIGVVIAIVVISQSLGLYWEGISIWWTIRDNFWNILLVFLGLGGIGYIIMKS